MYINVYNLWSIILKAGDFEAFGIFILLVASAYVVFPATVVALVLFYLGHDKKESELEQAKDTGVETPEKEYRVFFVIGFILLIPLLFWLFNLMKLF